MNNMTGNVCYSMGMEHEERFHKLLATLAARCRTELDQIEIEIYDRHLSPHGYEKACVALEQVLVERNGSDSFPSVNKILEKLDPKVNDRSQAIEATNAIVRCIRSRGYNWGDKVMSMGYQSLDAAMRAEMGELAFKIVKLLGGWDAVCELSNENQNYKTWIRDTAISVQESERAKQAPALAAPSPKLLDKK